MRRVDLSNYEVETPNPLRGMVITCPHCARAHTEDAEIKTAPYDVRYSLVELLFSRQQNLSKAEALERDPTARKLLDAEEDSVLLEEAEYQQIQTGANATRGYTRSDVEMLKRIDTAPIVDVLEKKTE